MLMENPKFYAILLLSLMSELFESLPGVGDPDKPKPVVFFDEAHLLFDDAPDVLQDKLGVPGASGFIRGVPGGLFR